MTNPYRSPEGLHGGDGDQVGAVRPGAAATLVGSGLLYRRLAVEAPLEMILEFNGRSLVDTVLVNHRVVARRISWWRISPRLEFVLTAGETAVRGLVEVRVWPWLAVRGFRVTIDDRVVYAEGRLAPAPRPPAQTPRTPHGA